MSRKLAIICSKGNLDMAYPGLILGNSALAEGIDTHLFFTFWGLDIVNKHHMNSLRFTFVGNTAMHMPQAPRAKVPHMLGALPGMTEFATRMMRGQIDDLDVPTVPEMLDQIVDMGGNLWACRMSFDMMKLAISDLHDGVKNVISAGDFMELSDGAQLLFI